MKTTTLFLVALVLSSLAFGPLARGQVQPSIQIVNPPAGVTLFVGDNLPLAVLITDPGNTIQQVTYSFEVTSAGRTIQPAPITTTTPPYDVETTVPDMDGQTTGVVTTFTLTGQLAITATALDSTGATLSDTVTITSSFSRESHILVLLKNVLDLLEVGEPTTNPFAGLHLAAGSTITLTAAPPAVVNTALDEVNLYQNGAVIASFDSEGTAKTSAHAAGPVRRSAAGGSPDVPFSASYTLPGAASLFNLLSGGFDALGNGGLSHGTDFDTVVPDHTPPQVQISNVTPGTTLTVRASREVDVTTAQDAADAMPLASVVYFDNGTKVGQSTGTPYGLNYQPASVGKHVLYAVATDASGLSAVSDPVAIEALGPTVNLVAAVDTVVIERTEDLEDALTVYYKVAGTAVAGTDYKALPGKITLAAGTGKAKIKIKPLSTETAAGTGKVKVKLLSATDGSYLIGTNTTAKIKVVSGN